MQINNASRPARGRPTPRTTWQLPRASAAPCSSLGPGHRQGSGMLGAGRGLRAQKGAQSPGDAEPGAPLQPPAPLGRGANPGSSSAAPHGPDGLWLPSGADAHRSALAGGRLPATLRGHCQQDTQPGSLPRVGVWAWGVWGPLPTPAVPDASPSLPRFGAQCTREAASPRSGGKGGPLRTKACPFGRPPTSS